MATLKDLAVGDVVEITYRAQVEQLFEGDSFLSSSNHYYSSNRDTVTIEIVKKAPRDYKVGDTIYIDDYPLLPVGSIVSEGSDIGSFVKAGNKWFSLDSGTEVRLSVPRELLSLPTNT